MSVQEPNPIQQLNAVMDQAREQGLAHQIDEAPTHSGRTVLVNGKEKINFGSCGYMSLEFDPRVKAGAIEAITNFGVELSCSRSFLSNPMYPMLEDCFEKIFGLPTVMAPTTTLAHLAALPVLVDTEDLILLDQQVHSSVQLAAKVLKAGGTQVEFVAHNNVARIERKIRNYKDRKKKIWYLGDGVYSMYGDLAPISELKELLDRYEQFHLYLDDAHGTSWMGLHGRGFVLDKLSRHERMIVATGLAKGFGTGGGVIICPTKEIKQSIRNCGGTQIFSAPLQPPVLGAALASAKIHLSPEFDDMQMELQDKIRLCNSLLEQQPLPLYSSAESPIRFLGVGPTDKAQQIVKLIMDDGFWFNIAQFPAVAPNHAGLRFMLTRSLKNDDIERFVRSIQKAVKAVIGENEEEISQIWKLFSKEYRYSLING